MFKKIILKFIKFYQKNISREKYLLVGSLTNQVCRFSPTCSQYSYEAIKRYGIIRGSYLTIKRIIRCNPFAKGGLDPVPDLKI